MNYSTIFKQGIPFIIGIIIGGAYTKNRYILGILITYMIAMFLFGLLKDKIVDVKKSTDKKEALKKAGLESFDSLLDVQVRGKGLGFNIFDKYYSKYIIYVTVSLFIGSLIALFIKQLQWALALFIFFNFYSVLGQIYRRKKQEDK